MSSPEHDDLTDPEDPRTSALGDGAEPDAPPVGGPSAERRADDPTPEPDEPVGAADEPVDGTDEPVDVADEPVDVADGDVADGEIADGDGVGGRVADEPASEEPTTGEHVADDPAGEPTGAELLDDASADDPDAPDVHPGAADPAAADSPTGRRDLIVVGAVVLLVLAVVAAFVLLRGGGDPAYTVYGDEFSVAQLQEQLDGLVDPELIEAAGEIEGATSEQRGILSQAISTVITQEVMTRAAADRDITVSEDDVDAQLAEVVETGFGGDQEAFESQVTAAGLTEDVVRAQFRTALLAEGLVGDVVDDVEDAAVQEAYDQQFTEPLVSHILTETAEEAEAARDRVDGGEDFAAVAAEVSIDTGSGAQGGQLGPLREGQFVPEFEDAAFDLEPGELSDVVETEFGFHIITVEDPPPFDEVSDQIRQALEDQNLNAGFTELAAQLDEEAMVTVNPDYGVWGGLAQGLIAPQEELPLGEDGALPAEVAPPAGEPEATEGG